MVSKSRIWFAARYRRLGVLGLRVHRPAFRPISTPGEMSGRRALFDHAHLSRVTACAFGRSLESLVGDLTATHWREGPLLRAELGPAATVGGTILTREGWFVHSEFVNVSPADLRTAPPPRPRAVVANSMQGLRYFGHWLSDDVSAAEAYRGDPDLVSLPLGKWADQPVYAQLFGQTCEPRHPILRAESMTLIRDLGFSHAKVARYRALRSRLRQGFTSDEARPGRIVFIQRGPSGDPREIANWPELERALVAAGVTIIRPEGDTRAFIRAMLDASIIITVEGSQDRHALYSLRDGGGMITIAPPDRFYVATHEWARALDMHSGIVVGTTAEGGFTVAPNEVLQMIDTIQPLVENRGAV